MNVSVIGSNYDKSGIRLRNIEKFQDACKSIGQMLAHDGHRLILPNPENDYTAEHYALKGFLDGKSTNYEAIQRTNQHIYLSVHLDAVSKSDAVILVGGNDSTFAAGINSVRRRKLLFLVPFFGGSADELRNEPECASITPDSLVNLDLNTKNWKTTLQEILRQQIREYPRILIIHGRGEMETALRIRLIEESSKPNSDIAGMCAPESLDITGHGAESIPKLFEEAASRVHAAVAIVTADDMGGYARDLQNSSQMLLNARARQNVWVEVGWFWGRLGRERIHLIFRETVEIPSDLSSAAHSSPRSENEAFKDLLVFLKKMRDQGTSPPRSKTF